MSISQPFIARPVATSLLAVALLILGVLGYRSLPVSSLPQVDFPTIAVTTSLPGANPETMAALVTAPLERDDPAEDGFVGRVGEGSRQLLVAALRVCSFVGELCVAVLKLLVGRARMRLGDLITESAKAGYQAFFIVSLIGYLIGLILAFIGAIPLKWFGAQIYTASLIGIGMLRLMAAALERAGLQDLCGLLDRHLRHEEVSRKHVGQFLLFVLSLYA